MEKVEFTASLPEIQSAVGLCECGCGGETPIAEKTRAEYGWRKGEPKRFIRGHNSRGKKRTMSAESCARMSAAKRGKPWVNRERAEVVRYVCSSCQTPFDRPVYAMREGQNPYCSRECLHREQRRAAILTPEDTQFRKSGAYKRWRRHVLRRDKHRCRLCGETEAPLYAHHVRSYKDYPAYRTVVTNGVTLCRGCHEAVHFGELAKGA